MKTNATSRKTVVRIWILALIAVATAGAASAQTISESKSTGMALPAHSVPAQGDSGLVPGAIISAENAPRFAGYLPTAAMLALGHGFRIQITPPRKVEWSAGFEQATEKYSPQVSLDKNDHLTHYVAGMPFPLVETSDPKAAIKIAYNWHMGPVLPDDFSLAPWTVTTYQSKPGNPVLLTPSDGNFACDSFEFLRYAHRTEVGPLPILDDSAGIEWKAKCSHWSSNAEGFHGSANVWIRYLDPFKNDGSLSFFAPARRVFFEESSDHPVFPTARCRDCHQPYWAYALPKTEIYKYRLLGTATILACMNADEEPAGIVPSKEGYALTQEPFQLRQAYVLEMTPDDQSIAQRTLIWIDSETYLWLAAEFFEPSERVATAIPLWRVRPASGGGNLFDLAGSFYFPDDGSPLRSVVPAHSSFVQKINVGSLSDQAFTPLAITR